jgi:hypothetical protein
MWVLLGLLVLGDLPVAWAQNTFPASGNVGIGTTDPNFNLSVYGTSGAPQITLQSTVPDGEVDFNQITPSGLWQIGTNSAGNGTGGNQWYVYQGRYLVTVQNGTGNVGIGTTSPAALLHVAGNAQVDGNIAAKYQDVAEWVPTTSTLGPGTVVVIDPQERNRVLPSAQPYDTRVAGVVSARPGLLLGEGGDDKAKVAQSGRVPVKVDASYGPIAAGDLLVTSPTPGYAMRSTPVDLGGVLIHRPGTLVGKALEPLTEGQGKILVLLTLQ